mgnify:CR=1 FL=1
MRYQSHVSARYALDFAGRSENHSSSGIIVSTGVGSTGWLSSVFNMVNGINNLNGVENCTPVRIQPDEEKLFWCVREPFASRASGTSNVCGFIETGQELVLASQMPENGVIFSDGIEADAIEFNTGVIAQIGLADEKAVLVTA